MSGLIKSTEKKLNKEEKSSLRILRGFPVFGKRTAVLYFPKSIGSSFSYFSIASLFDSKVGIYPVDFKEGETSVVYYEVRSSKREEPIIVMRTEAEAQDVVRRLSNAIAPAPMKWFWWVLGAIAFVWIILPSGGSSSVASAPALSIHTPMLPRPSSAATGPVSQAPSPLPSPVVTAPSAAAPDSAADKSIDQNDPFGLKLAPESK